MFQVSNFFLNQNTFLTNTTQKTYGLLSFLQNSCASYETVTEIYLRWILCSSRIAYILKLYTLYISNCSQLTVPLSMLQHSCRLSEALCQKCNSDLCCCFSCFYAGPKWAVHTTGDSSPSPRQPDPSHREKRYICVIWLTYWSVVCLASVFLVYLQTSSCHRLLLALMPAFAQVQTHRLVIPVRQM